MSSNARPEHPRRPPRSRSLGTRLMAASAALAVLVAGLFVVLVLAISDLSEATGREAAAKDVVTGTVSLQKLVIDLETGLRGFALTGEERLLQPWNAARRQLPASLSSFVRSAAGDATRERRARELTRLIRAYVDEYSIPLVEIARDSPAAARSPAAVREGGRRVEEIRSQFADFLAAENARAAETASAANQRADRAIALGIAGLLATAAMVILLGLYLTRSIARPVREAAFGATRIAGGELSFRLAERGPGEVGELTRAFNAMAADLAEREAALELQNTRLRQSERLKSELVSIVSHEIRTPLASVLGFTSVLLQREVDPETRKRYLEIVDTEGKRLASLLNDFLDVQRLEEGRLDLAADAVDLGEVVREQVALYEGQSESHRLDVRLPEEPLVVEGDANRLAQVISNLLSNAIKYSPDGGEVEVSGERENGTVRISVRDQGFGIPPALQDRIFTKFFRGSAAASGIPGSGLGLALARAIVEAHGGSIDFESAEGRGTTFSIELPRGPGRRLERR